MMGPKNILRNRRGFLLPMAMIFMVALSIGGLGFSQLSMFERVQATGYSDDHAAFYLANSGLVRAQKSVKIGLGTGTASWTAILNGSDPDYPTDPSSSTSILCNNHAAGCVIPPFQTVSGNPIIITSDGDAVRAPDLPFDGTFDEGSYSVRVYNNDDDPSGSETVDNDQIVTVRVVGTVRGEQKILETDLVATSDVDLVTCQGNAGDDCPDDTKGNATTFDSSDGKDPASHTAIPALTNLLTDTVAPGYYSVAANFAGTTAATFAGLNTSKTLTLVQSGADPSKNELNISANRYYFWTGSDPGGGNKNIGIVVKGGAANVVIISRKAIEVNAGVNLTDAIVGSDGNVSMKGSLNITAPLPYPAIISGGNVSFASASVSVYGNIYAAGTVDLNSVTVHGAVIASNVSTQGSSTYSDQTIDPNESFYDLMPGFTYPENLISNHIVPGAWREVQ